MYRPRTKRQRHYYRARPADQFDAVIHVDNTRTVEPRADSSLGRGRGCRDLPVRRTRNVDGRRPAKR
ncbi:MAG: hypothetical protein ACRDP9_29785 [Kribbellaceae bacterium]|nr:hypothetical protein [Kribbellaceae bacterium]